MMLKWIWACLVLGFLAQDAFGQVIELDDSFVEKKGDKPWLIMFYAPWCGHCKRLEPVYHQVYLKLKDSEASIRVAKIDATRYQSLASEYGVRGYPTIKFIQEERAFTHGGDRSKEGILEFAKRALGPQVRPLTNMGKFNDFRSDHSDQVFFMYVGIPDQFNDLYKKFESMAEKYAVLAYFATGEKRVIPADIRIKSEPAVLVFKDKTTYEYKPTGESGLEEFVNNERFRAFPKMAGGALNEFAELKKKVVIAVVDERDRERAYENDRFKEVVDILATKQRSKYHDDFQFVWMGEKETVDSITMMDMSPPFVIVLDPQTQNYYLPDFEMGTMTLTVLEAFLRDIKQGNSTPFGGTGFVQRLKRIFYDIFTTIFQIYDESAWLALLVFGVPALVISIVCYALCCMEPVDEDALYGELESDDDDYDDEIEGPPETKPLMGAKSKARADGHIKKE